MKLQESPCSYQKPSTVVLPHGQWDSVLNCLCERFPNISRATWVSRFERNLIQDHQQVPIALNTPYRSGMKIIYYRELAAEESIPGNEKVLYEDEHLLVVDKPPFLPVIPTGKYVAQTLLARLINLTDNFDLQPLHRIDRHTSGLVLFSKRKETRGIYQALFRDGKVSKSYQAIAPQLPDLQFPYHYHSRIVRGEPFFLSKEVDGPANSHTIINLLEQRGEFWRYDLTPVSGKKHQLRLHLCALGAPIYNDFFYPVINDEEMDNYAKPLQLLACELHFADPVSGENMHFTSSQQLQWPV